MKLKPGDYEPTDNGKEWYLKMEDGCSYTTKSQDTVEILSRLIELKAMLKKAKP